MAEPGQADGIVAAVFELAAADGSEGWLAAAFRTAAYSVGREASLGPESLMAKGFHGSGTFDRRGGLSGRWDSVVGAAQAGWLLLPVGSGRQALIPRSTARLEPVAGLTGLHAAGICDVTVSGARADDVQVVENSEDHEVLAGAAAAAAVVGSADGVLRTHVGQVRTRLATSHAGDEVTDAAAAQVGWAASDIDAARLQVAGSLTETFANAARAHQQAVARARDAADRLIANTKHALDASDPVTALWRDVHAGCRLAARMFSAARQAG